MCARRGSSPSRAMPARARSMACRRDALLASAGPLARSAPPPSGTVAGGERHSRVEARRILAQHRLDPALPLDERLPVRPGDGAQARDAVDITTWVSARRWVARAVASSALSVSSAIHFSSRIGRRIRHRHDEAWHRPGLRRQGGAHGHPHGRPATRRDPAQQALRRAELQEPHPDPALRRPPVSCTTPICNWSSMGAGWASTSF